MTTLIGISLILGIIAIFKIPEYYRNIYKVSYYEMLLKLNKENFDPETYKSIHQVINDKWLFIKPINRIK